MASKKFIQALELLESEKGIEKEVVLEALKEALEKLQINDAALDFELNLLFVLILMKIMEKFVYMKLNMLLMMSMMKILNYL